MKNSKILILMFWCTAVYGQQNFTLYPMRSIPQSHLLNPTQKPSMKWHLGIPALNSNYLHVSTGGFSLNRIFSATENANGDTLTLNLNKLLDIMGKHNYVSFKTELSLISGGFTMGNHYFHGSVTEKSSMRVSLPRDLFRFIIDGNGGANLGETFSFRLKADAIHYREFAAGYRYEIDDKISIGARVKYLQGFSVLQTRDLNIDFTTAAEDYAYTIKPSIDIRSASTLGVILPVDSTESGTDKQFKDLFLKSANRGMALDLGVSVKPIDKLTLSASIIDMGYIRWKTNTASLISHNPGAEYEFNGIHISGKDTSDDMNYYLQRITDSLIALFRPDTVRSAFSTALSTEFFIGGQYELNSKWQTGALLYGDFYNRRFFPALTLNLLWKPNPYIQLNITNTLYNKGFINPGLGLSINMGPLQFYGVSDNFLAPLSIGNLKNFSIRGGMNLVFGVDGHVKKEKKKKGEDVDEAPLEVAPDPPSAPE